MAFWWKYFANLRVHSYTVIMYLPGVEMIGVLMIVRGEKEGTEEGTEMTKIVGDGEQAAEAEIIEIGGMILGRYGSD